MEVNEIDDADTITVAELTTVNSAKVINLSDATDVGVTLATNVITIATTTARIFFVLES